jgi:hypothetical protein
MEIFLRRLRRVFRVTSGVVLFDNRMAARLQKLGRSPIKSFCVGALFGAIFGSIGALVAPEMIAMLVLMFGVLFGLLGAAVSGLSCWENYCKAQRCILISTREVPFGRRIVWRMCVAALPFIVCLAVALLTQRPLLFFLLFVGLFSWLLITVVGIAALAVEIIVMVRMLALRPARRSRD